MGMLFADDGFGWNKRDHLALWTLPLFLAYVGSVVGRTTLESSILVGIGCVAGIAVLRGIEIAIRGSQQQRPTD